MRQTCVQGTGCDTLRYKTGSTVPKCFDDGHTYDEDRCRAYVRHLPRNLACLTNVAIAIVRCSGRFRYLPEANRHYAARAQDALDAILIAPTA